MRKTKETYYAPYIADIEEAQRHRPQRPAEDNPTTKRRIPTIIFQPLFLLGISASSALSCAPLHRHQAPDAAPEGSQTIDMEDGNG